MSSHLVRDSLSLSDAVMCSFTHFARNLACLRLMYQTDMLEAVLSGQHTGAPSFDHDRAPPPNEARRERKRSSRGAKKKNTNPQGTGLTRLKMCTVTLRATGYGTVAALKESFSGAMWGDVG